MKAKKYTIDVKAQILSILEAFRFSLQIFASTVFLQCHHFFIVETSLYRLLIISIAYHSNLCKENDSPDPILDVCLRENGCSHPESSVVHSLNHLKKIWC